MEVRHHISVFPQEQSATIPPALLVSPTASEVSPTFSHHKIYTTHLTTTVQVH